MRYVKAALMCVALCCMGRAETAGTDGAMRRLGDLRRSDYVVTSLDGVTNGIAGLRGGLGSVSNEVVGLKSGLGSVSNEVVGLKSGLGSVSSEVDDLRILVSTLGGVTNDISSLLGFSTISNEVVGLKSGLGSVSNEVVGLESGLGSVSNAVAGLARYSTNSWNAADACYSYLEDYATNNYMAARLANYRALRLELWRQADTNAVAGLRKKSDNEAHAATYSAWDVCAYTTDASDWVLEFTPGADDAGVGTWSLMSGTNVLGHTRAAMPSTAVAIGTNDWVACSVDPPPTASRRAIASAGMPFTTYDAALSLFWDKGPALTAAQVTNGVTYVKKGKVQDTAIAIGRHAKAALPESVVASARPGTAVRSVAVAIGGYADAQVTNGAAGQGQAVAIGYCAKAKGINAVAIGAGAQHFDESDLDSGSAVALGNDAVAVGYGAKALGYKAVQIGSGTNRTDRSLQFMGVPIVRDGRIAVQADVRTNDVQNLIRDALSPQTVADAMTGEVVQVKSHTITTLAPTSGIPCEIVISPTMTRNYEIYIPNTPTTRSGLPLVFAMDPDYTNGVARLGPWWARRATRLPLLAKVRTPLPGTVLLDVETYDDGTDWTPAVTNVEWASTSSGRLLSRAWGLNLHVVAGLVVTYTNSADEVVTVATTNIVPTYGVVNLLENIEVTDLKDGAAPAVTVTPAGGAGYRTLNSVLDEKNAGWR